MPALFETTNFCTFSTRTNNFSCWHLDEAFEAAESFEYDPQILNKSNLSEEGEAFMPLLESLGSRRGGLRRSRLRSGLHAAC